MSIPETDSKKKFFEPILPGPDDWPVVQLSKKRKEFIDEVINSSINAIRRQRNSPELLREEIEVTMYKERLRIKENPWKIDPDDELPFWRQVKKRLVGIPVEDKAVCEQVSDEILRDIVARYSNEIAGNFKKSNYKLARWIVTFGFGRLLNAARIRSVKGLLKGRLTLHDKIHIRGEPEKVRKLARLGTIVMVPTHFSNLDSITIGWVIHALGLPPFIYGAGLNLFNISLFAYFMNSLGAYKVDRRKKNMIYLETLKTYSSLALQKGCHSLFFPGGTRSRSGKIETHLKLGLLGTAIETQRINIIKNPESDFQKIFIVPVVINYTFVLESAQLIQDYLATKGQERFYLESDRYSNSYKIIKFLLRFFLFGSNISVTIGRPMDLFGNFVDEDGNSLDRNGRSIDLKHYFTLHGQITENPQRESQYTSMLAEKIVKEFHSNARVFSSHICAFVAFELFIRKYPRIDFYSIFRVPLEELVLNYEEFKINFIKIRDIIFQLEKEGKIQSADQLFHENIDELIKYGIQNVGVFHSNRPLIMNKKNEITTADLKTLYYYRNRLDGYGLENFI